MTGGVVLSVLGPVAAEVSGVPVPLGGPRARALLAALALAPDRRLGTSDLVAEVWADGAPRSASRSLSAYVSRLRSAFGEATGRPLLYREDDVVGLRLGPDDLVDADQMSRALADAADVDALEEALTGWTFAPDGLPRGPLTTAAFKAIGQARQDARRRLIGDLATRPGTDGDRLLGHVRALLEEGAEERDWVYHLVLEVVQREGGHTSDARIRQLVGGAVDEVVIAHEPRPPAATGGRIVPPLTSFIGRERETARLRTAVEASRLVTVVGPAGAGKSRLAVEVARRGPWASAAMIVRLAGFDGPDVSLAILGVLGESEGRGGAVGGSAGWPGHGVTAAALEGVSLLVLDSCEHLVDRLAPYVTHLLATMPDLRVLVTSRRRLGVHGETLLRVSPLPVPDEGDGPAAVAASPAAQLFVDRARARRPSVGEGAADFRAIGRIVRHLDGLPLAIELAAAGSEALSPRAIADRLGQAGNDGPTPDIAPAMSAALRWSESLLSPAERRLFHRLSVFAGSFTLEAAGAVGGVDGPDGPLPLLTRLVDHSLLELEPAGDGTLRYRMLDSMRAYAGHALAGRGEADPARLALLRHFIPQAAQLGHLLNTVDGNRLSARMHADLNSVEAVLSWAMADGHVVDASHLIAALSRFWAQAGMAARGHQWMRQAVAHSPGLTDADQGRLLSSLMLIEWMQGDFEGAQDATRRLLPVADRLGSDYLRACCALLGGAVALHTEGPDAAEPLLASTHGMLDRADEVEEFRREWLRGLVLALQGVAARDRGDLPEGRRLADRTGTTYRRLGDIWGWGLSRWLLGTVEREAGDLAAATAALAEPVEQIVDRNELVGMAFHLASAAGCALDLAEQDPAVMVVSAELFGAADAMWDLLGMPPMPIVGRRYATDRAAARERAGEAAMDRGAAVGRRWSMAEHAEAIRRVAAIAAST